MLEKEIEQELRKQTEALGCLCLKFVSPGRAGVPDRIILAPHGRAIFVELKAPGKKPREIQLFVHKKFRELGFPVYVVDSPAQIQEVLRGISTSRISVFRC